VPVVLRFSNFAGVPTVADNDPNAAGPRGFAVRFNLAEHVHTDIVGHSHNGFPVKTGPAFLEFARALVASGPDATKPTPLDSFCEKHPETKAFLDAPKPIPVSYAKEAYFGVNAVKFTNESGTTKFGRYRILPEAGTEHLSPEAARQKTEGFLADELSQRLSGGPIKMRIMVQLAAAEDVVDDATCVWPEDRAEVEFGTITISEIANDLEPELRKIIFDPIPRVDGIEPSADPLIEVRSQIYLLSGRRRRQHSGA